MEDIAVLGLAIDSSSVPTADQRLVKLAETSATTERSTKSFTAATVAQGTAVEATAHRLSQYNDVHAKSVRVTAMAADATDAMAAAQRRATADITVGANAINMAARQADGFARLARQNAIDAGRAASRDLMTSVQTSTTSIKAMYAGTATAATAAAATIVAANAKVAASTASTAAVGYMGRPGQVGLNAQQRTMLGYQMQDVFTSLSSGMSPMMVAAQQGPQISMLYGGMGNMVRAIPKPLLIGGGVAAAVGAGLYGLNSAAEMKDNRAEQERRFGTLLGTGGDATGIYRDIGRVASSTATDIDKMTESVGGLAKATRDLGASRQNVLDLAATMERLTKISGANDNEAGAAQQGVANMLKQATVSADQLKTVLANVPQIAQEIAAGLGVSVTQLQLMASEGDLTNRNVLDALLKRTKSVNDEFAQMPKSIGSLWSSIGTSLAGATKNLADSIPLVREYRSVIEAAANAAKAMKEATTPETPLQAAQRTADAMSTPPSAAPPGVSPRLYVQSDESKAIERAARARRIQQFGIDLPGSADEVKAYYAAQMNLAAEEIQKWATTVKAAAREADEALVTTATNAAKKFEPLAEEFRQSRQGIDEMEKALAKLQEGITNLSGEEAARQIDILTRSLERAREKAANIDPALKSINDINRRNDFRANDNTPAGMALQERIFELSKTSNREDATTAALAEQQEKIADIVNLKQQEAEATAKITVAMGKGKQALIEAQTEAAVLAFIMANVGNNTEASAEQIKAFRDAVKTILTEESKQGGINAAKPLLDDLAAIAAAMKVVEQGAYAMKRAEADVKAARSDNGTGTLQMQVFDARQGLSDATTLQTLRDEVELTNKLAAAAGDVAKQKALQLDYDIKRAQQAAAPSARDNIDIQMRAKATADMNRDLAEGAVEIEKQVVLTQQQVEIVRTGNADYAAQLAMLQKKNELLARGVDISGADAQRQIEGAGKLAKANVELDRAREAADATKRIWMNAFDNVQSYGANVFYDLFRGVGVDGKTVAESLKNIFLRAFAEIAAAAIIRPIVAPIFGMAANLGFMPGGASAAAYGGGGGGSLGLPSMGGGSLFSGASGMMGSIGDFLNTPFTGPYAGMSPSSMAGVPMLSPSMMSPSTWGITPMQGIGALAGAGMGIYNLATSKSTGQTIGGIASLIGAGVSLIPGVGQIAGPLISMAGALLPSLFGEEKPKPPQVRASADIRWGAKGYSTHGMEMNGAAPLTGALGGAGKSMADLYRLAGGVNDNSRVWGVGQETFSQGDFSNGTSFLIGPNGERTQWGQGSNEKDIGMNAATANAAWHTLQDAVDISDRLRKALAKIGDEATAANQPFSFEELSQTVQEVKNFDDVLKNLGKTTAAAETALKEIDDRFQALSDTADKYGFDQAELAAKKVTERQRVGSDFTASIDRQFMDPTTAAMFDIGEERKALYANNTALLGVEGYLDQANRIEELYAKKRTDIMEEAARTQAQALDVVRAKVQSLQDLIDRLTFGDLANASPTTTFMGTQATYLATVAQARAGDAAADQRFGNVAESYVTSAKAYFGSNEQASSIIERVRNDAMERQRAAAMGAPGANDNAVLNALLTAMAAANANNRQQAEKIDQLTEQLSALTAQLARRA